MNKKILFISHRKSRCGVYEFGKSITDVLQESKRYEFIRVECSSLTDLRSAIREHFPAAIVYNYIRSVMPWLGQRILPMFYRNNIASIPIPQIGIIHEVTQVVADSATNYRNTFLPFGRTILNKSLFDFYIAPDPTLLLKNPYVYKTGRLIPEYKNNFPHPSGTPVIGSFGFAAPNKGFENIVKLVQNEFDEAIIRLNIPSSDFVDKKGVQAKIVAEKCQSLITKPGIRLLVTHYFLETNGILDFLAQNTVNMFLYEDTGNRGLSSTVDYAMAVQRPIAISDAIMFRHLFDVEPSVCVTKNNLKTIISGGFIPLKKHYDEWNAENILWEYERILDSVFYKMQNPSKSKMGIFSTIKSRCKRVFSIPDRNFTWLNSREQIKDDTTKNSLVQYRPVDIPSGTSLNRILDNTARKLYRPAVEMLRELVPITMQRKIAAANVQQAFVFDTVHRFLSRYINPRILCVGSFEDTASMSLIKMGYKIDEIDPTINYSLQEYFTKPGVIQNSYDIIFSTSVIEHDPDDESFARCVEELLSPGGVAIITCDFKEGWRADDPKPECNARLYTKQDLKDRLLPVMKNCRIFDEPQWSCPNPDFTFLGKFHYSFASFVILKKSMKENHDESGTSKNL
ncbi:MAG: hypothetical protein HQM08_04565 [Candidatus Riflebacteria bacterium]|nr:hypothetical protein [Candidatus Riflebacteria bacterium]